MINVVSLDIPEESKRVFKEQLEASAKAIQKYQNDTSEEGTRMFYYQVSMINSIKARIEIAIESKKIYKDSKMSYQICGGRSGLD